MQAIHYHPQQSVLNRHEGQRHTACIRYISAPQRSQFIASSELRTFGAVPSADTTGVTITRAEPWPDPLLDPLRGSILSTPALYGSVVRYSPHPIWFATNHKAMSDTGTPSNHATPYFISALLSTTTS